MNRRQSKRLVCTIGGMTIRRGYVDTPQGQVHYAEAGAGPAVLLIHHTPRSWTYYRNLLPLLADGRRVVALDTLGFGASDPAPDDLDITLWAGNVVAALDGLGIDRADVVGAMTGARIAMELAYLHPDRVGKVAYIAFPFFVSEEQKTDRIATAMRNSMGVPEADGTHILKVWRWVMSNIAAVDDATSHQPGVYVGDDDAGAEGLELDADGLQYLTDWMVDSTRAGEMWRRTASIVYTTDPTTRLPAITAPTLFIATTGKGFPDYLQVEGQEAALALVPDGRMALIDSPRSDSRLMQYHADDVAAILRPFLDG